MSNTPQETLFDPATQQVIDNFDQHAKNRATEMLSRSPNESMNMIRSSAFCLGYKAGVIELGASTREIYGASIQQMIAVYKAACAWRDSSRVPDALAGEIPDDCQEQLIVAIDASRKEQP